MVNIYRLIRVAIPEHLFEDYLTDGEQIPPCWAVILALALETGMSIREMGTRGRALEAATEAARIARIGYGQGAFSQIELLDAERTLAETRAAAIDALAAYHDAEARLRRLTAPAPDFSGDIR